MKMPSYCVPIWKAWRIPRSQHQLFVGQHMHGIFKSYWPVIQVFLVAKFAIFKSGKTPFDALSLPPLSYHLSSISREGHKLYAILPASRRLVMFGRVCMISYKHILSGSIKLTKDRSWIFSEPQISIEISHARHFSIRLENKSRCERCQCPAIFTFAAIRFYCQQLRCFQIALL